MPKIWHPFTQHALADPPIHIERAEGAYLYAKDGRRIIDGISSWWVNTHGHCHPHIVKAVQEQAAKADQIIFAGFTHDPAEDLAEKLATVTPPALKHVFFSDSGSIAVEAGLKMAIGFWHHSGKPRRRVLALEHGYHGDTFGAMALGARSGFTSVYKDFLFEVTRLPFPHGTLEALERELAADPDGFAAFIFEPLVLGAGGMLMYPPEILKELCALCRRYGVLLVADEVMTGWGRTGTVFACEHAGLVPDVLCLSKGLTGGFLPLAATLCTEEIYNAFYAPDRRRTFFHSSSYTANPLACAAAKANLEIWEKEPVAERVSNIAAQQAEHLKQFIGRNDVTNIRQTGTIAALDIVTEDTGYFSSLGPALYRFFLERGALLRPLGNTVYILPPYCITKGDLNDIYNIIEEFLSSSGIRKRSALLEALYRDFLTETVNDSAQHARFLNMLSLLEHIGSRKIMVSQMHGAMSENLLQHMAEETRHAYFFKRQARRFAGADMKDYTDANTMALGAAAMYFARLDAEISKRVSSQCPKPEAPYLAVSLIVELRACWAYPLYHEALDNADLPLSLKSIIAEEDAHLEEMYEQFMALPGTQNLSLAEMSAFETGLFEKLLAQMISESNVQQGSFQAAV